MTRSSHRWSVRPGSFDSVHVQELFATDGNPYDIATVKQVPVAYVPQWMVPYRTRLPAGQDSVGGAIHFFLDDYRFESVWGHPNKALRGLLAQQMAVLTPDFSLFANWPLAIQIWNTYRNRWCGARWQAAGLRVIPTITWSSRESYAFAFAGVEQRSVVAISTLGIRAQDYPSFSDGYREMIARLRPSLVLCYGGLTDELRGLAEVRTYPTRWERIRSGKPSTKERGYATAHSSETR